VPEYKGMAAIDDLNASLISQAANIVEDIARNECLCHIAEYINLWTAITNLSSSQVTSYSIQGRSFTRSHLPSLRGMLEQERAIIDELLAGYAGIRIDFRYVGRYP
jgi:hypothetical protein